MTQQIVEALQTLSIQRQLTFGLYDALWSISEIQPAWVDPFVELHIGLTMEVEDLGDGVIRVFVPSIARAVSLQ